MEYLLIEMVSIYAPQLMKAILYFVFGLLILAANKYIKPILQNKVIAVIAKNVVMAVEQTYKDLHGDAKLRAALVHLSEILEEKNIHASEAEMIIMIEAAVAEFNEVFKKPATE